MAIETGAVQVPSFVPVDQSLLDKQNIIITKDDVRGYSQGTAPLIA